MAIKAVIFDLDGTIATFNLDYKIVRSEVRNLLLNNGIPASLLSVNENIFDMLNKTEMYLKNQGKPATATEKLHQEAMNIAEEYEMEAATRTSLLSGAIEILRDLKAKKLKLALCTINSEKSMEYILKRFNLTEFFDATVPREKTTHVKPHPQHLEIAIEALKVKPGETVVVGDSPSDMQAAKDLKTVAVGLPTGISNTDELTRGGANYIITNITDLPLLIEQLNKTQTKQ
jgi:HAD superfamily hydrolase (TIGR01509 family)